MRLLIWDLFILGFVFGDGCSHKPQAYGLVLSLRFLRLGPTDWPCSDTPKAYGLAGNCYTSPTGPLPSEPKKNPKPPTPKTSKTPRDNMMYRCSYIFEEKHTYKHSFTRVAHVFDDVIAAQSVSSGSFVFFCSKPTTKQPAALAWQPASPTLR